MTVGQKDIMRYIQSVFPEAMTEEIGESIIRVTAQDGTQTDYTMNIYGDVLQVVNGKNQVIAISDLPHNLTKIPTDARPNAWTKLAERSR